MSRPPSKGLAALGSIAAGTSVATVNMFIWIQYQYYFARDPASVYSFYLAQAFSIFLLLLGFYMVLQYLRETSSASPTSSLLAIIGSAVSDGGLMRVPLRVRLEHIRVPAECRLCNGLSDDRRGVVGPIPLLLGPGDFP
jgi:hypothetical protein